MSQASQMRGQGFAELVAVDSETVVLMKGNEELATVQAVVDWEAASPLQPGQPDLTERNRSRVEVSRALLTTPPVAGQSFKDEDGLYHRITKVKRTDNTFKCECEVDSEPE